MLTGTTISDCAPDSFDAAIAECLEAEDLGGPGHRDVVRARYPEWANELAAFFATNDRFERLVAGQPASVKYDPSNPSDSILVADDWSGLR